MSTRWSRLKPEEKAHLEPSVLVSKVVRAGARYQAELGARAPVLALLVLGLYRQLVTSNARCESLHPS